MQRAISVRAIRISVGLGLAGVAAVVSGLVWDARLHAADPGLAGREGVLSLSNPGHALLAGGMVLMTAALALAGALAFDVRHRPRTAQLGGLATVVALAGLSGGTAVWATSAADSHHDDAVPAAAAGAPHTHDGERAASEPDTHSDDPPAPGDVDKGAGADEGAGMGMEDMTGQGARTSHRHPLAPLARRLGEASPAQRAAAEQLLADVRATVAPYEDEADALADGFVAVADPLGINVHYRHFANLRDGRTLDPRHPEGLVYRVQPDGTKILLGAVFVARAGEPAPTPGGPIIVWHSHDEVRCPAFRPSVTDPCDDTTRMLHVWTPDLVVDPFADGLTSAVGQSGFTKPPDVGGFTR